MTTEAVALASYVCQEMHPSELGLPDGMPDTERLRCPRCNALGEMVYHGHTGQCAECGLHLGVWGDVLVCSDRAIT